MIHEGYRQYLDPLDDPALDRIVSYTNSAGASFKNAVGDILLTTGMIFGLLVAVHIWRMLADNPRLAADPIYLTMDGLRRTLRRGGIRHSAARDHPQCRPGAHRAAAAGDCRHSHQPG